MGDLTAADIRAIFDFDVLTGEFIRRVYRAPNAVAGQRIRGAVSKNGYRVVHVGGKVYYSHRLVWLHVHGKFPPKGVDIDHINGDRQDNRLANLRLATRSFNNLNRASKINSQSGFVGVSNNGDGWQARLQVGGITHRGGTYKTPEQAYAARLRLEAQYTGTFRGRD